MVDPSQPVSLSGDTVSPVGEHVRQAADTLPFVGPLNDLAVEDPLAALAAVQRLRWVLGDAEALAVTVARSRRFTWQEIAGATGSTVSTAHRHFQHLDRRSA